MSFRIFALALCPFGRMRGANMEKLRGRQDAFDAGFVFGITVL